MNFWIYIITLLAVIPFVLIPTIYAIQNTEHITISLSDTCLIHIQNNFTTTCPKYDEILAVFPDTSEKTVSGDFEYDEHGFLQRSEPQMKKHREYYRYHTDIIYWIDPPADIVLSGAKKIVITTNDFIYPVNKIGINTTALDIGKDRYVSSTCGYAIISSVNWLGMLGDTLQLMKNECNPKFTNFNDTFTYKWKAIEHDITTSKKWIYENFIKETKEKCNVRCNQYDTVGQPKIIKEINKQQKNYSVILDEYLIFDNKILLKHVVVEQDPCKKAGPLCDYYRYKNTNHTGATSSFVKLRNDIAGGIGE